MKERISNFYLGSLILKSANKIIMVIIGTLVGAGFASGREIYLFFGQYGIKGLIGIIISGTLSASIIYIVLKTINEKNIYNYSEFLQKINPNHKKINKITQIIVNSFLLISFFIMISAFSAYILQNYQISRYISSTVIVLICYIVFEKSLQGMMKVNTIVVPFLLFFIVFLGIKNIPYLIQTKPHIGVIKETGNFLISSILYTSYNSIILIPVLVSMKTCITNKKQIKRISIITGIAIIILSFCIYGLLLKDPNLIQKLELPLLEIAKSFGINYKNIYSFIIMASIFTSAISAGYSFLKNVSKTQRSYKINLWLVSIGAIIVSKIGFSNLVGIMYPFFGILGLLQIWVLFKAHN